MNRYKTIHSKLTMTSLEQKYQKKTDKEHVLDNPGTYTGSMEPSDYNSYIFKDGK